MDYSRAALASNAAPTPAPPAVNYPLQEAYPSYRLPPIPEMRENVPVHPSHSDTRVFQPPAYGYVEVPPVQAPQPVQVAQAVLYTGGVELNQLNLHSLITGEALWFNLSL